MAKGESYTGFSFGDWHSSDLGILRTSEGDRYTMNLSAKWRDVVTDLSSMSGQYYWGSYFTNREFTIPFSFLGLTEQQLRLIKETLNDNTVHPLIFDEEPHKVWYAKVTGLSTCKYLCSDNGNERTYAGNGTIIFTTYYPFAKSRFEYLEDYGFLSNEDKKWLEQEGLPHREFYGEWTPATRGIELFNHGDLPAPFRLSYSFENLQSRSITIRCGNLYLSLSNVVPKNGDTGFVIDCEKELIYGIKDQTKTNNLYNDKIVSGGFFKIPKGEVLLQTDFEAILDYNYLYL